MLKKISVCFIVLLLSISSLMSITFAAGPNTEAPKVNCIGLPGCSDENIEKPGGYKINDNITLKWVSAVIGELIKYVAVVAVLSVMISGVLYLVSGGEEEKVKKAKTWIIWSLVGVFLSVSAWGLINLLNNLII